jgi:membrane-associated protease RseP (regulator of RpoE activity)
MTEPEVLQTQLKKKKRKIIRGPFFNVSLFILTLFTTWMAGASGIDFNQKVINGFLYMGSLMSILLAHEMGHYVMARRNRVDASLPYFIPVPPPFLLGTFGAVIVMRGRIRSRSALMEVGAAGPLAGMVMAIPILIVGLALSPVEPIPTGGLMEGNSLLYLALKWIVVGRIPEGKDVILHPMAWAGWIGLLVTMLNLIPIGQLDGGHIFFALFGDLHRRISRLFFAGLFFLGAAITAYETYMAKQQGLEGEAFWTKALTGSNWLFLGLLVFVFFVLVKKRGLNHPPTDDNTLSPGHRIVGIICLVLFVLTFMPVPLRILL